MSDSGKLSDHCSDAIVDEVARLIETNAPAARRWQAVAQCLLAARAPFRAHTIAHTACFVDEQTPWSMWTPSDRQMAASNLGRMMSERATDYPGLYEWSITRREEFWADMVVRLGIQFHEPPSETLNTTNGVESPRWLTGGRLNIVESCLRGEGSAPAIISSRPDGGARIQSREQLRRDVLRVAGSLRAAGFERGARLAILMPMIPESVVIYLGIIAAGCVAVSIADSFAAPEIRQRLEIANAAGIFCVSRFTRADRTFDLFERVCQANALRAIVIGEAALRAGDLGYQEFLDAGSAADEFDSGGPETHINILFSSGTTGDPKAIPWNQTVPIKCASDGMLHHDIREGDVVVWPTNIGWMMGPWLIFASLINRAAIGLYHDTPGGRGFGQFVQDAGVTMLGVVPTIVRAWRQDGCMEGLDWSAIRCFSSTGEASSADDMFYLSWLAGFKPVIEYCGGTEIGGGYACSTVVQPNVAGCFSTAAMGSEFVILDESGSPADEGELFLVPPSMGLSTELLNRNHHDTYFAATPTIGANRKLRRHGDYFERLPRGFYRAGGRADDTMNLGGIKIGSTEIERVLNTLDDVGETAAVAVPPPEGGPERLVVFVVPVGEPDQTALLRQMNTVIKSGLNPLFRVSELRPIEALPRTASNKVMRRKLRAALLEEQAGR